MPIRILDINHILITHHRNRILAPKLHSWLRLWSMALSVPFDRKLVAQTKYMSNLMQERVLEYLALVRILQGIFVAADVLDFVGKESAGNYIAGTVGVWYRLVVDEEEVGLAAFESTVDGDAEVDGVPFVGGFLERRGCVGEIGFGGEAFADGEVPM